MRPRAAPAASSSSSSATTDVQDGVPGVDRRWVDILEALDSQELRAEIKSIDREVSWQRAASKWHGQITIGGQPEFLRLFRLTGGGECKVRGAQGGGAGRARQLGVPRRELEQAELKWLEQLRAKQLVPKLKHLGLFLTEGEAARAFDEAVRKGLQEKLGDGESADAWLIDNSHSKHGRQGLNFPTQAEFDARPKPLQYPEVRTT